MNLLRELENLIISINKTCLLIISATIKIAVYLESPRKINFNLTRVLNIDNKVLIYLHLRHKNYVSYFSMAEI